MPSIQSRQALPASPPIIWIHVKHNTRHGAQTFGTLAIEVTMPVVSIWWQECEILESDASWIHMVQYELHAY